MSDKTFDNVTFWAGAVGVPLIFGLGGLAMLLRGYVIAALWNWFAAPFTPIQLSVPEAVGLSCLLTLIWARQHKKVEDGQAWNTLLSMFSTPLLAFAFGFVAHLYLGGH